MSLKRVKLLLLPILLTVSLFFLLDKNFLPGISSKLSPNKNFELLGRVIRLIKSEYVEEPNPAKTMEGAFKGLVDSLDVLSSYLDKDGTAKYNQQKKTNLKDIGVVLYKRFGLFPQVIGIVENSPAEKAGIKIGDYFSTLDNQSTLFMSLVETNLYLKGEEENPIKLKILRDTQTQEISVKRALLFENPISYSSEKGTAGILKIHHLYPPCVSEIKKKVLPQVKKQKGPLILDLRNCYEGDTEEALKLINLFLKEQKIGYFEKKGKSREFLSCPEDAELKNLPLAIWTNQATMGSAEVVAAVLKDFKKAKTVGLVTLGLAVKQELFPLDDGSALLLTSGIFCLNSGEKLWGQGVRPEEKVEIEDQSQSSYLKKTLSLFSSQ
jgi:C-terminal peptidase prc